MENGEAVGSSVEGFYQAIIAFVVIVLVLCAGVWMRYRDPLHPAIILLPQLLFIYGLVPVATLQVSGAIEFSLYAGGWESLTSYQYLILMLTMALFSGIGLGSWSRRRLRVKKEISVSYLRGAALLCGLGGLAAWIFALARVGGFDAAYGHAYGGGWLDSGYLREATGLGVIAAPLYMLAQRNRRMSPKAWMMVLLFLAPILVQGLLGARRGPTFMALVVVFGSYLLLLRRSVPLWLQ